MQRYPLFVVFPNPLSPILIPALVRQFAPVLEREDLITSTKELPLCEEESRESSVAPIPTLPMMAKYMSHPA